MGNPYQNPKSMAKPAQHFHNVLSFLNTFVRNRQFVLFGLGIVIGAVAAGAAIAFRDLIGLIQFAGFGSLSERLYTVAGQLPWWQILLVPTLGGLMVGLLIHFYMPDRRPRGVPDVMEAAALHGGRMGFRTGMVAALASMVSIGCGASVGREGPVVHLGATLSAWIARKLHLSRQLRLTLLGCGAASAIAASFNTPIAGVFFALEVVVGHYALSSFAPIVIASVTGTIISRLYYGNFPAFTIPNQSIASFLELPAFALLGVVTAIIATAFIKATMAAQNQAAQLPGPVWIRPAMAGLLLGGVGIAFPHVFGVGYETTDAALSVKFSLAMMIGLLILKWAMTVLCLGAGFSGGVFSPALVMGALAGGAFGIIATAAFPELSSGPGTYAIVGMGALAGAVLGAPISTILIIFELTSNFTLTIAVMVGVVVASVITEQAAGHSFFIQQLKRRGISLDSGRETGLLRSRRVDEIMRDDYDGVPEDMPMPQLRARLQKVFYGELFMINADGALSGTITLADLSETAFETSYDAHLKAVDVARANPPVLPISANLEEARCLLDEAQENQIAVVEDMESMKLVGFLRERDVMAAYNQAMEAARAEERGEAKPA